MYVFSFIDSYFSIWAFVVGVGVVGSQISGVHEAFHIPFPLFVVVGALGSEGTAGKHTKGSSLVALSPHCTIGVTKTNDIHHPYLCPPTFSSLTQSPPPLPPSLLLLHSLLLSFSLTPPSSVNHVILFSLFLFSWLCYKSTMKSHFGLGPYEKPSLGVFRDLVLVRSCEILCVV